MAVTRVEKERAMKSLAEIAKGTTEEYCYGMREHEWTPRSYSRMFEANVQCCRGCGRLKGNRV